MKRFGKLLSAAAASALLCATATPAYAQDATDALLLKLKEKGILSDEEYEALLARKATQANTVAATNSAEAPQQAAAERLDDKKQVRTMDSGVGIMIGDVAFKVSGSVNGFYVHDNGDAATAANTVAGGLATVDNQTSSVRNGLLPGFIKFDVTTNQGGWDVGAHFGLYPGINSGLGNSGANGAGAPQALQTTGIDARQTYLTFGKPNFGEVKIGRDIGLFGSDAILNDITLLAVGTASGNAAPSNTSLGRIGLGYIYTDFQPQITYSSPKFGGLQFAAGIFQPLTTIGRSEVNGSPGFQAKITYDMVPVDGGFGAHAWVSGLVQKHDAVGALPEYTGRAIDFGAKLSYANFGLTGYYYTGTGVGTIGLFLLSTDALGRKRDSDGFYVQGTAGFGKFTAGASYGKSNLDRANGEAVSNLVRSNESYVGQLRYGLTSWVTLIGEYTHTKSKAHNGNDADSDAIAAGAILFF
ncbi:porin [Sphingomonas donggukensis]|uniref:Porin n=1 Tax=Sphingomonas donggukensis TaxID=2949093 RepID=A0ABY4U1C7_9SPHN|nr:porin [Sphingomonas donggukensis]URW76348.1 porin [Sphingomonas donggukensis]